MAFQLTISDGPDKGRTVDLPSGQTVVLGRGEDCDVQLADPRASRVHCRFIWSTVRPAQMAAKGSQPVAD